MRTLAILFFAFVPVLAATFFVLKKKICTIKCLVFLFFQSAVVLVLLSLLPFDTWLFTACSEELLKFAVLVFHVFLICRRDGKTSLRSILAQALILGLFFAGFETIVYALRFPNLVFVRLMTAVPLHAALTILSASGLHQFVLGSKKGPLHQYTYPKLFLAIALHAGYNFFLERGRVDAVFISFIIVILSCTLAWYIWNKVVVEV